MKRATIFPKPITLVRRASLEQLDLFGRRGNGARTYNREIKARINAKIADILLCGKGAEPGKAPERGPESGGVFS